MTSQPRPRATATRRRVGLVVTVGLLTLLLAGLVAPSVEPVYGQTGPRLPTPSDRPGAPLATVPAGVPTVAVTVVVAPPGGGGAPPVAPSGAASPAPAIAPLPTIALPASPSTASATVAGPASVSAPGAPPKSSGASPNDFGPASVPTAVSSASGLPDIGAVPAGPAISVATPAVGPPPGLAAGAPVVAAVVPPARDQAAGGLAVISSADSSPVRITVFAPPRADGPVRLTVGAPNPASVSSISLPNTIITRAFTVDASRADGTPISTHPRPLTLVVGFTDADLAFAQGDPRRLHILRWDPDRSVAIVLDTTVDLDARTLSATTDHTSLFLVASVLPGTPRELVARARTPWGVEPAPTAPIPSAMPRVGGYGLAQDAGGDRSRLWVGLAAVLGAAGLALGATLAAPRQIEPETAPLPPRRRRWRKRYLALVAALLLVAGLLTSPTARLLVGTLVRMPQLLFVLGGFGTPRTFLVIGQSADEPRPTGGFMGSMGVVGTRNGSIQTFDYRNSREFEDSRAQLTPPPGPLARYAGLGGWQMRDANWSPDFPTSMAQIDWFWQRDQGARVDGAVAFTEEALAVLLRATGPVVIAETGESVGADDVRRWIAFQLYPLGRDGRPTYEFDAKTGILSALGRAIVVRLTHPRLQDLRPFAGAVAQLVREKHVLLWFRDPGLEDLAHGWGADGQLADPAGDYLDVVDTSVTLNKIGRYIATDVDYLVDPRWADGVVHARTTITYENRYDPVEARRYYPAAYLARLYNPRTDRFDDIEGLWATWLRIYVPAGATLLGASGLDEPAAVGKEAGKTTFGAYVTIGIGERRRVSFEYDVPYRDPTGVYDLFLQRQPGITRTYAVRLAGSDAPLAAGTLNVDTLVSVQLGR